MNSAIIVAAGSGKRFGGDKPKQFLEFAGKTVLAHTLKRFENCAAIDEIILVLSVDEINNHKFRFSKLKSIVAGGATRAESVLNGLQKITAETAEVVAVHDGARPLVTAEEISRTIEKAKESGAACLVAPVTDTIKQISGDKIEKTIDRATLRRALTPQCFQFEILQKAFRQIKNFDAAMTDESFLVEQLGVTVSVVEGSPANIKITVPEDLILAEALYRQFHV